MDRHPASRPAYPGRLARDIQLPDGTAVALRPIRPEDAAIEQDFVSGLSPKTKYLRFMFPLRELTPEMLADLTQVDYEHEMAMIAVIDTPEGDRQIGVARYSLLADCETCRFAIVVGDDWQGKGLARHLMGSLLDAARDHGLTSIEGVILAKNKRMKRFARSMGFQTCSETKGRQVLRVRLALQKTASEKAHSNITA